MNWLFITILFMVLGAIYASCNGIKNELIILRRGLEQYSRDVLDREEAMQERIKDIKFHVKATGAIVDLINTRLNEKKTK